MWQDEFNGPSIDLTNWTYDIGGGGWGNNEWQFYTDRADNARIENGVLVIEAREESFNGRDYTSARLKTQGLQEWTYGRVEARLKLPYGQGVWSAFWMLGEDFPRVGWPESGEIDIMENIGDPSIVYGTVHGPGYSGANGVGSSREMDISLSEDFHVYAVEWAPEKIQWYVDEVEFHTVTPLDVPGQWVYDHEFFILLNLAVGGNWPGYPEDSTVFPQQLLVDYVRVYRSEALEGALLARGEISVGDIVLEIEEEGDRWRGVVHVSVMDQDGQPVPEAFVKGGWLGVVRKGDEDGRSNAEGVAGPFRSQDTPLTGKLTFCVTEVDKPQYTYVKAADAITCVFVEN